MRPEADWTALEKDCSASAAAEYSRSHALVGQVAGGGWLVVGGWW
jgi:hypothetical protein